MIDVKRIFLIVAIILLVTGCSTGESNHDKNNNDSTNEEQTAEESTKKSDKSISFSDVNVIVQNKSMHVTGDTKLTENFFYYKVVQGDQVMIEEQKFNI